MARRFVAASSQYLSVDAAPVTAYPFTFGAWVLKESAVISTLLWIGDSAVNNHYWRLQSEADGTFSFTAAAGGGDHANTTATLALNTWGLVVGVATSATDRAIFLNGGNKVTNASDFTPLGASRYAIGMHRGTTPTWAMSGLIDRPFVYQNVALTDAEVAALYAVGSPLRIRRANLVDYRKLGYFDPEPNWVSAGNAMTVVGAVRDYGTPGVVEMRRHRGASMSTPLNLTQRVFVRAS